MSQTSGFDPDLKNGRSNYHRGFVPGFQELDKKNLRIDFLIFKTVKIYNLGTPTSLSELHKVIKMSVQTDMGWEIL